MSKAQLAFGKIQSYRKYELFMERYRSPADDFILPYVEGASEPIQLLDVGAGEGYLKHFCNDQRIDFHGVEIDDKRIKICKDLGYKIWTFDVETEPFPFSDNSYDIVVASHVLEHLYDPTLCMKEIYRVLKPGGLAIIGVPMHIHWISKLLQLKNKLFPAPRFEHHQFFSMKSLRKFLSKYNIEDIRGFRLISSRKKFNWEDNFNFYRFNTWWGKKFPSLTPEVNVVIKKKAVTPFRSPITFGYAVFSSLAADVDTSILIKPLIF